MQFVDKCVVEQDRCSNDEERRHHGISPRAIRARSVWLALTKYEDTAGGDHVEEPFGEDREFKEVPKRSAAQLKGNGHHRLDDKRQRWRMEARMDVSQGFEEVSIAGHGKRNAPSAHDGAIERHKHR